MLNSGINLELSEKFWLFKIIKIFFRKQLSNSQKCQKKLTINGRHIKTLKTNWSVQQAKWRCSNFYKYKLEVSQKLGLRYFPSEELQYKIQNGKLRCVRFKIWKVHFPSPGNEEWMDGWMGRWIYWTNEWVNEGVYQIEDKQKWRNFR